MSDVRNGKIARQPCNIREELNRRLQDGELGTRLVDWLNARPEVQKILKDQFEGRPISEQNLFEWKQGGYQDWLRHQEARCFVQRVRDEATELKDDSADVDYQEADITEHLAVVLGAELARAAFDLLKETDKPLEHWRRLRESLHEHYQLGRHNHRARRLKWDQRRWQREEDEFNEKAERNEFEKERDKILAPILLRAGGALNTFAEAYGGGEAGRKVAAFMLETMCELPPGSLNNGLKSGPVKPGQN